MKKPQKIKIMFIIDFIYKITGGTENQLVKLINNLDVEKYDLYLLSLRSTSWLTENTPNLHCTIKAFNYNVFNHKDPRNFITFIQMIRYTKNICPDIVMTFFRTSYILGVLTARLAGVRSIISTRRDYGLWLENMNVYLLKLSNKFVDAIVTNSHKVKELTSAREGYNTSKISVIYNGIDFNNFNNNSDSARRLKEQLGIPESNRIIGIVAGLRPMKKHETFLKAAKRILKERSDVNFVLIGDGHLRKDLEGLAVGLGIEDHTNFVGWQEEIQPFLSILDIGVNCSANEGLSNAIIEYMAYGVPCIVSDAGGNPELIENGFNGYTFELDSDKELAELIISLLQDTRKQEEFVLRSKDIINKKMSLKRMIDAYDNFFDKIYAKDLNGCINK